MALITRACVLTLWTVWSGFFASTTLIDIVLNATITPELLKSFAGYSTVMEGKREINA